VIARTDPRRHPRFAARWLLRYLEEADGVTMDEGAMAASLLASMRTRRGVGRATLSPVDGGLPYLSAVRTP
jgi:hypothetical protein